MRALLLLLLSSAHAYYDCVSYPAAPSLPYRLWSPLPTNNCSCPSGQYFVPSTVACTSCVRADGYASNRYIWAPTSPTYTDGIESEICVNNVICAEGYYAWPDSNQLNCQPCVSPSPPPECPDGTSTPRCLSSSSAPSCVACDTPDLSSHPLLRYGPSAKPVSLAAPLVLLVLYHDA